VLAQWQETDIMLYDHFRQRFEQGRILRIFFTTDVPEEKL
jgi:hypothetical protein